MSSEKSRRWVMTWGGPVLFGVISALALYLALVLEGWIDVVCGILLLVVAVYGLSLLARRD